MDESVGIVLGDLEGEHKVRGQGREEEYKHQEEDYRCISDTKVDMKSSDTVPAKINVKEETRKKVKDIIDEVPYQMPEINNAVRGGDKHIKVMFPKEIHSVYQVSRKGSKEVEINKNSKKYNLSLLK